MLMTLMNADNADNADDASADDTDGHGKSFTVIAIIDYKTCAYLLELT